jgi:hypothetical protein
MTSNASTTTSGTSKHPVEPNVGSPSGDRTSETIRLISSTIQTKPTKWGEAAEGSKALEPWFSRMVDGVLNVTIPTDLESFADDPGVLVAVAALTVLQPKYVDGLPMSGKADAWVRCHTDVDQYYLGIAASLKEGAIVDFPNYAGWFGKGYNLIGHRRLVKAGLKPWFLRGSETPLRKVWSHKSWGDKLPSGYKHLEVLVRLASDALILSEKSAESWVVPLQTLRGSKLKKELPLAKTGFLLQPDIDALSIRYKDGIKTFMDFNTQYSRFTFGELCELDTKIARANNAVRDLERTSESIIDHRASLLYPATLGRKKKSRKEPLKERLSKVDLVDFANRFNPCEACGIVKFTTSYSQINATGTEEVDFNKLEDQFFKYVRTYPDWKDVLVSWWNTEFLPRYG